MKVLRQIYRDLINEEILKRFIEEGTLPSQDLINKEAKKIITNDLSSPMFRANNFKVEMGEVSSSSKFNKTFETAIRDLLILYKTFEEQDNNIESIFKSRDSEIKYLENRLISLREEIQSILMAKSLTTGYFNQIYEDFISLENTFFKNDGEGTSIGTNCFIDITSGIISLPRINTTSISPIGTEIIGINADTSLLRNNSQIRPGSSNAKFELIYKLQKEEEISKIDFEANNYSLTISCLYSLDNVVYKYVPAVLAVQKQVKQNISFVFSPVKAKYIKLFITSLSNKIFEFKTNIYKTSFLERSNYFSKVIYAKDFDRNNFEFNKLSLSACEKIPAGCNINYFVYPVTQTIADDIEAGSALIENLDFVSNPIVPVERSGYKDKVKKIGANIIDPYREFLAVTSTNTNIQLGPTMDLSNIETGSIVRDNFNREFYINTFNSNSNVLIYETDPTQSITNYDEVNISSSNYAYRADQLLLLSSIKYTDTLDFLGANYPTKYTSYRDSINTNTALLDYKFADTTVTENTIVYAYLGNNVSRDDSQEATIFQSPKIKETDLGWKDEGNYYSTYFYIDKQQTIDFGKSENKKDRSITYRKINFTQEKEWISTQGTVTFSEGLYQIQILKQNWAPIVVEDSWTTANPSLITSNDPLYPYNHKYLIEGLTINSSNLLLYGKEFHKNYIYPTDGHPTYFGARFYFSNLLYYTNRFNLIKDLKDKEDYMSIIPDTNSDNRIMIKYDIGNEDNILKYGRFIVRRTDKVTDAAVGLVFKIELGSLNNPEVTPIVENIKFRLEK